METRVYKEGLVVTKEGDAVIHLQVSTDYDPRLLVEVREPGTLMFVENMEVNLIEFLAGFMTPELYAQVQAKQVESAS